MNRWLLLYSMVVFATALAVYIVRFRVSLYWRERLHQLMLSLLSLAFGVFGSAYVAAGNQRLGWMLIAVATFGSVLLPLRPVSGDRAIRNSGPV